ncbi:hypothetical protein Dda3937_04581 [Dickeya dadantii 3937]|uniref:Uncharacterized protein n=1 Tax=Dickeya dadantii (strain 3937) TaxID=198628 RepID=E0SC19_DICD3|nr:hypothetical protein Dda3937_04581 [Dickeya dadantii 3937]
MTFKACQGNVADTQHGVGYLGAGEVCQQAARALTKNTEWIKPVCRQNVGGLVEKAKRARGERKELPVSPVTLICSVSCHHRN